MEFSTGEHITFNMISMVEEFLGTLNGRVLRPIKHLKVDIIILLTTVLHKYKLLMQRSMESIAAIPKLQRNSNTELI